MKSIKGICLAFLMILVCTQASAQIFAYSYSVKFVCGTMDAKILGPGVYHTAINVLNPNANTVKLAYRVSDAKPGESGGLSDYIPKSLEPYHTLEIDCPEIFESAGNRNQADFLKGFVIIYCNEELDIVAVYTATGRCKKVESIHTERVPARKAGEVKCPDLVVKEISKPVCEDSTTIIKVTVVNIGTAPTGTVTKVELTDPSTIDPATGHPYQNTDQLFPLDPGEEALFTFYLPYCVYNPDAYIRVRVDIGNQIPECDESNNTKEFVDSP